MCDGCCWLRQMVGMHQQQQQIALLISLQWPMTQTSQHPLQHGQFLSLFLVYPLHSCQSIHIYCSTHCLFKAHKLHAINGRVSWTSDQHPDHECAYFSPMQISTSHPWSRATANQKVLETMTTYFCYSYPNLIISSLLYSDFSAFSLVVCI